MIEQTVADLKPAKQPKSDKNNIVDDKVYEFELCTRNEATRPKDKKTDQPLGSGYPPHFSYPNHGSSVNPEGKVENWRYIEGQNSIWVSEQTDLAEYERKDIDRLLGEDVNQLDFKDGRMLVVGNAAGRLRLEALFNSDYYEGKTKKYQTKPPMLMFRLNNPDAKVSEDILRIEKEFKTLEQAMNCTIEEMLAVSSMLRIDISDQTAIGLNRIKKQFLDKARFDTKHPKGLDFFMEIINNPETKVNYIFTRGLDKGLLSVDQQPGKLTWTKLNTEILELKTKNAAQELTWMVTNKTQLAIDVMLEVERLLKTK